jgi:hypothetical protein
MDGRLMVRPTRLGRARPVLGLGLGYDPDVPTGETPETPDYADDATWEIPAVAGDASIAFVQSKETGGDTSGANSSLVFDDAPVAGNLLVAVLTRRVGVVGAPAADLDGWTEYPTGGMQSLDGESETGNTGNTTVWYKVAGVGESSTVSIVKNGSYASWHAIAEFSGGVSFDSATNQSVATLSNNPSTGNLTPTAGEAALLVGAIQHSSDATFTIGGSFTEVEQGMCGSIMDTAPATILGYRVVDPTSGAYAMTAASDRTDSYVGALLAFTAPAAGSVIWLDAFAANDGNAGTSDYVDDAGIAAADDVIARGTLSQAVVLDTVTLHVGMEDAGSATIRLEGSTDLAFTSPVSLDTETFTAIGAYATQPVIFSPTSTTGYLYLRFVLTSANQGARVYEVSVNGASGHEHSLLTLSDVSGTPDNLDVLAYSSNTGLWTPRSTVHQITSNTSNALTNPFVNLVSGTGIAFAAASNTLTISSTATGGGAGASVSYGSNATRVAEVSHVGDGDAVARATHYHDGIGTITASSSNTMQRGTWNLRAGTGIALSLTDTDGDGEFDTTTIVNTGSAGGGGGSLTVSDEGSPLSTAATTLDFVGAGVTATGSGATKTITIPGGSGSGDLTLIASTTLGADNANITITGIPNTYTDLVVSFMARSAEASEFDTLYLRMGDGSIDSGSNYSSARRISGSGSADLGTRNATFISLATVTGSSATSGAFGGGRCEILNYADTSMFKIVSGSAYMDGASDHYVQLVGGIWKNSGAEVDQVNISLEGGNDLKAGSRLTIWGRT